MKIGAQFFTLRDFCKTKEDFSESLKKVADMGYSTVQISGTCEYEPEYEYFEYTGEKESGHRGILQNFANAVLFGERLIASGYEGIDELMLSNAAYFSQWTGNKKISLPFDEEEFDRLLRKKRSTAYEKSTNSHFSLSESYNPRWKTNW